MRPVRVRAPWVIDGVLRAPSRISGMDRDDEDAAAISVHPPSPRGIFTRKRTCRVGRRSVETSEMRNVAGDTLSSAQQIAKAALHSADTFLHETTDLRPVGRSPPVASALQSHVGIKQSGVE